MAFRSAGIQKRLPKVPIAAKLYGSAMAMAAEQLIGNPSRIVTVSGNVDREWGRDAREHPSNLAARAGWERLVHGASNRNTTNPMNGSNIN